MLDNLLNILKDNGDKVLYQINDERLTYYEGYLAVNKLSNSLINQGSEPVVVYGHKSIGEFISILACLVAKRTYIPIDLCTPYERIKEIIKLSGASLVIKNEEIDDFDIPTKTLSDINKLYYNNDSENHVTYNDIAYIIFTSGSTGVAKGVPISYNNLEHFIKWISISIPYNCKDELRVLSQASFSFDLSLMDLYYTIYNFGSIMAVDGDTKENLILMYNKLLYLKANFLVLTPTFIKMLLIDNNFNSDMFKNIKYMFFCGETLEVETVKKIKMRFPFVKIINAYGPTEATCCVSLVEITNDMLDSEILPVGVIDSSAVDITIANDEIILKGDSVFKGYLGINSVNCFKEENKNCYKTGDIGYIYNGYLYCKGRMDNQIKYQGYRIELSDIENNLLKINDIREAVVIAKYKDNSNIVRLIKAFVVVNGDIDEEEIKKELIKYIPRYMIPKKIVIIDKIPVNNSGKYDRRELEKL